jgi:hypothetical protein
LAGYKKVTKEDAEVFLKLYEKYLLMKFDDMKNILKTLPSICYDVKPLLLLSMKIPQKRERKSTTFG